MIPIPTNQWFFEIVKAPRNEVDVVSQLALKFCRWLNQWNLVFDFKGLQLCSVLFCKEAYDAVSLADSLPVEASSSSSSWPPSEIETISGCLATWLWILRVSLKIWYLWVPPKCNMFIYFHGENTGKWWENPMHFDKTTWISHQICQYFPSILRVGSFNFASIFNFNTKAHCFFPKAPAKGFSQRTAANINFNINYQRLLHHHPHHLHNFASFKPAPTSSSPGFCISSTSSTWTTSSTSSTSFTSSTSTSTS